MDDTILHYHWLGSPCWCVSHTDGGARDRFSRLDMVSFLRYLDEVVWTSLQELIPTSSLQTLGKFWDDHIEKKLQAM